MYFETRHIPYTVRAKSLEGISFDTVIQGVPFENIELSMLGEH